MPTVEEDLVDTYMNKLLARAAPSIKPRVARSSLATITGNTPLTTGISSLKAIGQGLFGAEIREQDQEVFDAEVSQLNFENQRALDKDRTNIIQRRAENIRANKIVDLKDKQFGIQRRDANIHANRTADFKDKQFGIQQENAAIADATQRNTAQAKLGLIEKLKGLRDMKKDLLQAMTIGKDRGLITAGGAGQDFTLTDKGKANLDFAAVFGKRSDIDDETKRIQDEFDQDILKRSANKNKYDDIRGLSAQEIAGVFLAPSKQNVKAAADLNASKTAALQSKIKELTQGKGGFKNNAFSQSLHDIAGGLDKPATDLLDSLRSNAEDPTEINRLFGEAQKNIAFQRLDDSKQRYVFAKFLKDKKGVGSTKNRFGDSYFGEWSSETVTDNLSKYIDDFNKAVEMGEDIAALKTAHQTDIALDNLRLKLQ